jgi:hypothetical protein
MTNKSVPSDELSTLNLNSCIDLIANKRGSKKAVTPKIANNRSDTQEPVLPSRLEIELSGLLK